MLSMHRFVRRGESSCACSLRLASLLLTTTLTPSAFAQQSSNPYEGLGTHKENVDGHQVDVPDGHHAEKIGEGSYMIEKNSPEGRESSGGPGNRPDSNRNPDRGSFSSATPGVSMPAFHDSRGSGSATAGSAQFVPANGAPRPQPHPTPDPVVERKLAEERERFWKEVRKTIQEAVNEGAKTANDEEFSDYVKDALSRLHDLAKIGGKWGLRIGTGWVMVEIIFSSSGELPEYEIYTYNSRYSEFAEWLARGGDLTQMGPRPFAPFPDPDSPPPRTSEPVGVPKINFTPIR